MILPTTPPENPEIPGNYWVGQIALLADGYRQFAESNDNNDSPESIATGNDFENAIRNSALMFIACMEMPGTETEIKRLASELAADVLADPFFGAHTVARYYSFIERLRA